MNACTTRTAPALTALALSTLMLAACGGGGGTSTGTLSLSVQDAPVDGADAVNITFSRVELHRASGETLNDILDSDPVAAGSQPYTVNLMDYQGVDRLKLLDGITVPADRYEWIRLYVDAAAIVFNQGQSNEVIEPLDIPSNENSGLKLHSGFSVAAGGVSDFTVEFDLRKSVHEDAKGYTLRSRLATSPARWEALRQATTARCMSTKARAPRPTTSATWTTAASSRTVRRRTA
ncbi:MAG: DUF4382 domain-containing protein [Halothiobacillaceae bacterium]|nr:MAG: DUF4382 domain-containing protein [Halothiobacillaceae bacterium]